MRHRYRLPAPCAPAVALVLVLAWIWRPALALAATPRPDVNARAAVLIDLASGRELYAKNAGEKLYPASTVKILTALVALEHGRPDAWVTVSEQAAGTEGSSLYLKAGDRLRLIDLLYGMMLVSGNDAAEAVAQAVAGSRAAFVRLMNETAAALGATGSHFTNPSGLPDPDMYTTAHDLALIARAALANPTFARIVATRAYTIHFEDGRSRTVYNENRLLGKRGVDGVKTGYTRAARHTYVASASRDGLRLAAVLLRDSKMGKYEDAQALLRFGFSEFHAYPALLPGQLAAQSQVAGGTAFYVDLTLPRGDPAVVAVRSGDRVALWTDNPEVVPAPVRAGAVLGQLRIAVDGRPVETLPLIAARSVRIARAGAIAPAVPQAAARRASAAPAGWPAWIAWLLRLVGRL